MNHSLKSWLLVGLGNPGDLYKGHRHNIGFQAMDFLSSFFDMPTFSKFKKGLMTKKVIRIGMQDHSLILFKPLSYMNLSGPPVAEARQFYKIPIEQVLIFHDDMALPLGRVKVKWGGGAAGHNGLKSLDDHLGSGYGRLRLGIDHPGNKEDVTAHVLSAFRLEEQPVVKRMIQAVAKNISELLFSAMQGISAETAGKFLTHVSKDLS